MIVTLTDEKQTDLKEKLENLLERETLAIREVASVVGHMSSIYSSRSGIIFRFLSALFRLSLGPIL